MCCAHLDPGAKISAPSQTHAAAPLVVHGKVTVWTDRRIQLSGGMGGVLAEGEAYRLETDTGAILLIVESAKLTAHPRGISSSARIAGQTWQGDPKPQTDRGSPVAGPSRATPR